MDSVDRLRDWANGFTYPYRSNERQLLEMADAIESEVAERYVELPKDCNGEYIHLGDLLDLDSETTGPPDYPDHIHGFEVGRVMGICLHDGREATVTTDKAYSYYHDASRHRHHRPDTWERIIEDAAQFGHDSDVYNIDMEKFVARCEALAGEGR